MTIANSSPVRGVRVSRVSGSSSAASAGATTFLIGQATAGMPIRGAGTFLGMWVQCNWAAGTNGQTIVFVAHKNDPVGGNRLFQTTLTQTGAASGIKFADNVIPVNPANCVFADGDTLFVSLTTGTTGAIGEIYVNLDFEAAVFA